LSNSTEMDKSEHYTVLCECLKASPCNLFPNDLAKNVLTTFSYLQLPVNKLISKLMLIKFQPDATVCRYLFTAKSLYMFRVSEHPSSGVLKTVTANSGTGHNTGTATSLHRGLIRPRWREVAVSEAAVTVFSTPDDGCCDTRNM